MTLEQRMARLERSNKIYRNLLVNLIILFFVAGCLKGGITDKFPRENDGSGKARIIIIRTDETIAGSAVGFHLTLDGQEIAVLGYGEHVVFFLVPGSYSLGEMKSITYSYEFKEGQTRYLVVKQNFMSPGNWYMSLLNKPEAEKILKRSKNISNTPYIEPR